MGDDAKSRAAAPAADKAEQFHHLQLRSVLDEPGSEPDETWAAMLHSDLMQDSADVAMRLALPSAAQAEESLLSAVEALTKLLAGAPEAAAGFFRHFGWTSADEYFATLGETQAMLVDTDHNDLDDRFAVVLLAFQMASANAERRRASPAARCKLLLDVRTYEGRSGLAVWRTLRLAVRLHGLLWAAHGLAVEAVLSDRGKAMELLASHLGILPTEEALDAAAAGAGAALTGDGVPGCCRASLAECLAGADRASLWLMSGVCARQAADVERCVRQTGVHFLVLEQAQPAWQSVDLARGATVQPPWAFPPPPGEQKGFGAEPSNLRSGEEPYPERVAAYLLLQKAIASAPARFTYISAALARSDAVMPVPPGKPMRTISGRPLNVVVGAECMVKKALDADRASRAFAALLAAARERCPDTLHAELCTATLDDAGRERTEMAHMTKYGTFMADAILVALAARPTATDGLVAVVRRLAFMRVP